MNHALLILAAFSIGLTGCGPTDTSIKVTIPQAATIAADPTDTVSERTAEPNPLTFRTWGGVWGGTDEDAEFELHADGIATLTVFGNAVAKHSGAYRFVDEKNSQTALVFEFPGSGINSPTFTLYTHSNDLLLVPTGTLNGKVFLVDQREWEIGDTIPRGNYWLLREITAAKNAG